MSEKPIVGVISRRGPGRNQPIYSTNANYLRAVSHAGGLPLQLPMTPELDEETIAALLANCRALLVPGGPDIDPSLYGGARREDTSDIELACQRAELRLVRMAAEKGLPVLGICLGEQIVNAAFGGTLIQDIPTEIPAALAHQQSGGHEITSHSVSIARCTLLHEVCGCTELQVNSFHHQAVAQLAPGFRVSALAPDGVVEAIELPEKRILGVQWHPEWLEDGERFAEHIALFRWLVGQASQQ